MLRTFLLALACVGIGITATDGWAQETAAQEPNVEQAETDPVPATDGAETETEAASEIESQLSLGEVESGAPQVGETYLREKVGDWDMRCLRTETPEDDPCQMYQLLLDEQGAPVAEFTLFRLPDGGQAIAGATVIVPLETALQQQLRIRVDQGASKRYPFTLCNPLGCYARIGLTAQDVASYRAGATATLTIVPALAPDQPVNLPLSLIGFTKGFEMTSVAKP